MYSLFDAITHFFCYITSHIFRSFFSLESFSHFSSYKASNFVSAAALTTDDTDKKKTCENVADNLIFVCSMFYRGLFLPSREVTKNGKRDRASLTITATKKACRKFN